MLNLLQHKCHCWTIHKCKVYITNLKTLSNLIVPIIYNKLLSWFNISSQTALFANIVISLINMIYKRVSLKLLLFWWGNYFVLLCKTILPDIKSRNHMRPQTQNDTAFPKSSLTSYSYFNNSWFRQWASIQNMVIFLTSLSFHKQLLVGYPLDIWWQESLHAWSPGVDEPCVLHSLVVLSWRLDYAWRHAL